MYGLDLFTGIGGITLALQKYVKPIAYCEIEPYCQSVLLQRMQEGNLPKAPIWDDIRTFNGKNFRGIDIIYGGFPCQDISVAGLQKGLEGKRSSLFFEILRILDETKAPFIFLENVPNLRTKGAERVCKELSERGYDCRWCNISAADVGARHKRERWFLLAHTKCEGSGGNGLDERLADKPKSLQSEDGKTHPDNIEQSYKDATNTERERLHERHEHQEGQIAGYSWFEQDYWTIEPKLGRVANGIPNRIHRIKALGNSVVPLQVKTAFKILMGVK